MDVPPNLAHTEVYIDQKLRRVVKMTADNLIIMCRAKALYKLTGHPTNSRIGRNRMYEHTP